MGSPNFFDRPVEERSAVYDRAERETGMSFFDLPAEDRAAYYDREER